MNAKQFPPSGKRWSSKAFQDNKDIKKTLLIKVAKKPDFLNKYKDKSQYQIDKIREV